MDEQNRSRFNLVFSAIFLLVIIVGVTLSQQRSDKLDLMMEIDDDMIGIACDDVNFFLPYQDIKDVELTDDFSPGVAVDGGEAENIWYGTYQNDDFGIYQLFAYKDTGEFIVVTAAEQNLVFNCSEPDETKEAYEQLLEALEEK